MRDEQIGQYVDHVQRLQLAPDPYSLALAGKPIHDFQHEELASNSSAILNEVMGQSVVQQVRPRPYARAIIQP